MSFRVQIRRINEILFSSNDIWHIFHQSLMFCFVNSSVLFEKLMNDCSMRFFGEKVILAHFIWDTDVSVPPGKLQTGWSQDQVPHMWDLIFAPACLPPALYLKTQNNAPNRHLSKTMLVTFSKTPFCISKCSGITSEILLIWGPVNVFAWCKIIDCIFIILVLSVLWLPTNWEAGSVNLS